MRVLVTGHRGYIGSVLTTVLQNAHVDVVGLDCDLYDGCDFGVVRSTIPSFEMDLREIEFTDLLSFDAVIHLASLPEVDSRTIPTALMESVNFESTVRLAECCKQASVSRFLFASTCAVYGSRGSEWLNEGSAVSPTTAYAHSKMQGERALADLADGSFTPMLLRNPTIYGVSPRMRLDLVVNDFVGAAVVCGRVTMRTLGNAWRPLLHVEDLSRAYLSVLTAPDEALRDRIVNVVDSSGNRRVIDVADAVVEEVPGATRAAPPMEPDERSYRVDGSRFRSLFPGFRFRWNLARGIRQLRTAFEHAGLAPSEWRSDRFRRSLRLGRLRERNALDDAFQGSLTQAAPAV